MRSTLNRCRVLITEDDPSIRNLIALALRRRRLEISTAKNGEEALRHLAEREWVVMILDLMMPGVSGWQVLSWLSEHQDRKPGTVIVVSATDRAMLQQLDPGMVNAVFFKPFDVLQLGAYVKASCEISHPDRRRRRVFSD